jgi:hypothetical protein
MRHVWDNERFYHLAWASWALHIRHFIEKTVWEINRILFSSKAVNIISMSSLGPYASINMFSFTFPSHFPLNFYAKVSALEVYSSWSEAKPSSSYTDGHSPIVSTENKNTTRHKLVLISRKHIIQLPTTTNQREQKTFQLSSVINLDTEGDHEIGLLHPFFLRKTPIEHINEIPEKILQPWLQS